ncbi:helix-turn-helix domain-containing protein [Actinomadura kijaniata]|uniref:helix-turn-helix domain-containing protein n=1 Tax=Actinomadura kijaniata TaxID=46161 RepID=UPI003F1C72B0
MPSQPEPYEEAAVRAFAAELSAWRTTANLTKRALAEAINYAEQYVGQIELSRRVPSPDFAAALDAYFQTNGVFARLWKRIDEAGETVVFPPGFPRYLELEAQAKVARVFCLMQVTGLLQTVDYAREVLLALQRPAAAERLLESRTRRQELLTKEDAPHLFVTLDERVLHSGIGGPETMRAQLAHLLKVSESRDVMIDVVPQEMGSYVGLEGSFTILGFENRADVAYTEAAGHGTVIEDPVRVADYRVRYDLIRGYALPIAESRRLIESIMEKL